MFSNTMKQYISDCRLITRQEAGALHDFVESAARKLGISKSITLIRSSSKEPNLITTWFKSKKSRTINPAIIITDGALEMFGGKEMSHTVSDSLKVFLSHEMSHVKDGMLVTAGRVLPLFALPLAFACGYYVLDKAHHAKSKNKDLSLTDAVKQVVVDEKLGFSKIGDDAESADPITKKAQLYEQWLRTGGTVAAGAVGLAAGMAASRHLALAAEFRADRMSAALSGCSPETCTTALKKILQDLEIPRKICFTHIPSTTSTTTDAAIDSMMKRVKQYWQNEMRMLDLEVVHAHPTTTQRETALKALKPSPDFRTRLATSGISTLDNPSL